MEPREVRATVILMSENDMKLNEWRRAIASRGGVLRPFRPGAYFPIDLVRHIVRFGRPSAVAVRYLNEEDALPRALLRAVGQAIGLGLCVFGRIRVIWLCHNVDQETRIGHPRLSRTRRRIIAHLATRIFVLDPLLLDRARSYVPPSSVSRLDWMTFGVPPACGKDRDLEAEEKIRDFAAGFRERREGADRVPLVGLCLGDAGPKYIHFDKARSLIEAAKATEFRLGLVVGGDVLRGATAQQRYEFEKLAQHADVLLLPYYVAIDECQLRDAFDFFWRGYVDLSMSYTLYVAAAAKRPVLSLNTGFVARAVRSYGLGAVVRDDFRDLSHSLRRIQEWDPSRGDRFLSSHRWDVGAERLLAAARH